MIFWIVVALLAGGLGVAMARPLLRGAASPAAPRGAYDAQVYRDQLAEIGRDRARGVLSDDQAAAARLEVERRLLAASSGDAPAPGRPGGGAPLLAAGIALAAPVLALLLYAQLGRPGVPGQPFAQRMEQRGGAAQQNPTPDAHPTGSGAAESMQALTERLAKRLEANPGDAEGWSLLARSYQQLERHRDAVAALERAVALTQRDPQLVAALAEARIMAADGTVPPQARAEFEEVLKRQPKDARARFYVAVAEAQAGKMKEGLDLLVALARDTPPEAPYLPMLRERIAAMAGEMKQDPARVLADLPRPIAGAAPQASPPAASQPSPQAPSPQGAAAPERGPTAADVAAAQNMSAGDRQQMIRGMVDGLAARLDGEPGDVEGWLRLIRAYKVLGEDAKAADAASRAAEANPAARPRIVETARQLGVGVASAAPAPAAAAAVPLDAAAIRAATAGPDVAGFRRRLDGNPNDREALFQVGLAEAASGNRIGAAELWGRLLGQFAPGSPEYAALREKLDALKRGG
ncbi:MAG: c-type cytochrome biogenesis protein CcmI [Alphaproteobacteria bacterium]|nr:c-type cytochrome biogenesis protein CcmI [Alphaproteobacteria bacterium]